MSPDLIPSEPISLSELLATSVTDWARGAGGGLQIVASELRDEPEWDGSCAPFSDSKRDGVLISVPPTAFPRCRPRPRGLRGVVRADRRRLWSAETLGFGVFRYVDHLVDLDELGSGRD